MTLYAFITLICFHGDRKIYDKPLNLTTKQDIYAEARSYKCQVDVWTCESKHPVAFKINPHKTMVVCKNEKEAKHAK